MARTAILGNGSLTIGLNEQGLVNDFYYPYVGLDNLNTSRSMHHRIGVWAEGEFNWTDSADWQVEVDIETDALVTQVVMRCDRLQVELELTDFVDHDINAFCRKIRVTNTSDEAKTIRIFMHQVFEISRRGRADTALYVPEEHYMLDYKGRCSLLIYGQHADGEEFDQFSVGNYGIEGKEGTYIDAEDGELSGNAVEHGGVDSVIRLTCELEAKGSDELHYWIVAADSQYSAELLHHQIKAEGLEGRLKLTRSRWQEWLGVSAQALQNVPADRRVAVRKAQMVIKAHTDKRGGIIASCDSSIYNYGRDYYSYVWPRDGAYAMWPLIKLGYRDEPKQFFEFCRDILTRDGYLMHKYQPDRAIGSTWHPLIHGRHSELAIQEDETAIVIFMLGEYLRYSDDEDFVFSLYNTFVQPAANFLTRFVDTQTRLPHASYDLWEEKFLTSTYTTAVTYRALLVAAELADRYDYPDDGVTWRDGAKMVAAGTDVFFDPETSSLRKGYLLKEDGSLQFDNVLDVSSLFGAWKYRLFADDNSYVAQTAVAIEQKLLEQSPIGGSPRYEHDNYFESKPAYQGNPWFVTTLWLAQYYASTGNTDKASKLVDWTLSLQLPSGMLSEQVEPTTGVPISVTPLVWSHAELINAILDLQTAAQE
ncbi:glycoside hydrolase family 15 protein [soil metagenome]